MALLGLAVALGGCGGGGAPAAPGPHPPAAGDVGVVAVGPMLIRPASTGGFIARPLETVGGECAFVALWGAEIEYLASQAMLDRIVFARGNLSPDIWVCNLDGSHAVKLTDNAADERRPAWSPDGAHIAFDRLWSGQDSEIITMNAYGSSIEALTSNTDQDSDPTWSPDGRRIAYSSLEPGNWEICARYADGSGFTNLTNHGSGDQYPDWSPSQSTPLIAFCSGRTGDYEVYTMEADGSSPSAVTSNITNDYFPTWHPGGYYLAMSRWLTPGEREIFRTDRYGSTERRISNHPATDDAPAWSGDGRWIAFHSDRSGNDDIWLQETDEPYRAYRVTSHYADDAYPDLGSPVMQTERVLIGPSGSDWGGLDPIWASAYAGVVAFGNDGYRNFVRIGIHAADVGSLDVTPLVSPSAGGPGGLPVGVLVEAATIVNLREDAGRGEEPTVWDLDPLGVGAAVLYFDGMSGKLISVLAVDDAVYPSAAAAAPAVRASADGAGTIVVGAFSAVFDARGRNLAPRGASRVALGADGGISLLD